VTGTSNDGQTLVGESLLVRYYNFVKLPHTLFALPFALLGIIYASFEQPLTARVVGLVVVAFTGARFAAMGFNRIVDRDVDALNQRTKERELPAGRLTVGQARGAVIFASVVFVGSAAALNTLCLILSPVALVWILSYSFTKRFTSWSHLWLGASLAIAPVGGYLAVTGRWSEPPWALGAVAVGVLTWVAGFDIFYALQDEEFDRGHGLKSAVVALGEQWSILAAKVLHGITILMLVVFALVTPFGTWYYVGIVVAAAILAWEHHLVKPGDLGRLDAAFFQMNGVMSVVVFVFALGDRLL